MSHETVEALGDENCMEAVRALTLRVTNAIVAGDEAAQRITQKQLATAVLRWVILRDLLPGMQEPTEPKVGSSEEEAGRSYFRT